MRSPCPPRPTYVIVHKRPAWFFHIKAAARDRSDPLGWGLPVGRLE